MRKVQWTPWWWVAGGCVLLAPVSLVVPLPPAAWAAGAGYLIVSTLLLTRALVRRGADRLVGDEDRRHDLHARRNAGPPSRCQRDHADRMCLVGGAIEPDVEEAEVEPVDVEPSERLPLRGREPERSFPVIERPGNDALAGRP